MCLRYFKIIIVFHPHLLHIFSGGEINNWGFIPNASGWKYANWCPSSRPRVRGCLKLHMFAPLLMNCSVSTRCLIGQRPISKRWCIICIRTYLWNYHGNGSRLSHCASKVPRWLQHLQRLHWVYLLIPEAYCCHIPRRHWFHKELCLTGEACGSRVPLHLKLRKSYVFMGSWIEFGADPSIDLSPYLKVVPLDNVRLQLLPNGWLPFR